MATLKRRSGLARGIRITPLGHSILAAIDAGTYRPLTTKEACARRKRDPKGRFQK